MKTTIETVTPQQATAWLTLNFADNRPISRARVEAMTRAMDAGGWQLTHQGIGFDMCESTGPRLVDGQHRLSALARASVPIQLAVTRYPGVAPVGAFDTGAHRATRDLLVLQGVTTRELSRAASAIASAMIQGARLTTSPPTYRDIASVYQSERESIDWAARALYGRHNASTCAAFAAAYPVATEEVDGLAHSVVTAEGLVVGTAAHTLHQWLASRRGAMLSYAARIDCYTRSVTAIWHAQRGSRCAMLKRSDEAIRWLAESRAALGLSSCT